MLKYSPLAVVVCAAGLILSSGPARSATVFYSQNFESTPVGNNLPAGWTQVERDANDVAIINLSAPYNHVLQLRDYIPGTTPDIDASATTAVISTIGWEDVILKFDWKGHNAESSDKLYVDLKIGDGVWENLVIHSLNSGWDTDYIALDEDASNTTIQIRFWTNVTDLAQTCSGWGWKKTCSYPQGDEAAKIDNVYLKGTPYVPPVNPEVPLPGALPLFASVVALVGTIMHRRRRRDQQV